jgi:hypothetical protein
MPDRITYLLHRNFEIDIYDPAASVVVCRQKSEAASALEGECRGFYVTAALRKERSFPRRANGSGPGALLEELSA